jgi:hypothetical protein
MLAGIGASHVDLCRGLGEESRRGESLSDLASQLKRLADREAGHRRYRVIWTAKAKDLLEKVTRAKAALNKDDLRETLH